MVDSKGKGEVEDDRAAPAPPPPPPPPFSLPLPNHDSKQTLSAPGKVVAALLLFVRMASTLNRTWIGAADRVSQRGKKIDEAEEGFTLCAAMFCFEGDVPSMNMKRAETNS